LKTVKEVSNLTKISVRTLHYYDEINLLKPAAINSSGYRLYDNENLETLQQILFFKELGFPLKEIREILSNPNFDKHSALKNHRKLLVLKKDRLKDLINLIDDILKGEGNMSFKQFDQEEIQKLQEQYINEVKEKYGNTSAYEESLQKTSNYSNKDWKRVTKEIESLYMSFAENMDKDVASKEIQDLVKQWQDHITKNFYNCTNEILKGLGQMYIMDERFTKNIDKYKPGLALFISHAIEYYCKD